MDTSKLTNLIFFVAPVRSLDRVPEMRFEAFFVEPGGDEQSQPAVLVDGIVDVEYDDDELNYSFEITRCEYIDEDNQLHPFALTTDHLYDLEAALENGIDEALFAYEKMMDDDSKQNNY
jgi:hypothetical protein